MIKSMTAFGRAKLEGEERDITVEIRSVNSRFLDCSVKLPRAYMFLEEKIKEHIKKNAISRGKVDVFITVDAHRNTTSAIGIDTAYAKSYVDALYALRDALSLPDDISVMTVARNQDIFTTESKDTDLEAEWEIFRSVLDEAISGYIKMRTEEGENIFSDISEKVETVRKYSECVEEISKSDTVGYRAKLEARIRQILSDMEAPLDENRLLTECAIWADKIAIDEELVRLHSHFDAFYEIARLPEPSGRKLDFLMQEMNRETNTIGSKCNNAKIARIVVDMKGELEKIREQVQNIE
jgi:uncharacterized protein (TIGR00255 family)